MKERVRDTRERDREYRESLRQHGAFDLSFPIDPETLLANAAENLASANEMAATLAFDLDDSQRAIALGMSDDFEIAFGRAIIQATRLAAPGLQLIFRQTYSAVVGDMLQGRALDLALVSGGISSRTFGRETVAQGRYACLVDARSAPSPT